MTGKQAKQITRYILNTLEYLDGRGIVFTDRKLVREALKPNEEGRYPNLDQILKS